MNPTHTPPTLDTWPLVFKATGTTTPVETRPAARREEIVARKAKDNQRQSLGRGKKGLAKLPNLNTRAESARAAGVGERTYDAGKRVLAAATFTDAVLNGSAMPKTLIIAAAKARGMTFRDAETWFAKAQVEGLIEVQIDPDDSRKKVYGRHGGQNGK